MKSLLPADPCTTVGKENVVNFCCSFNLRVKKKSAYFKTAKDQQLMFII